MIKYKIGTVFSKWWYWFEDPKDIDGVSMVNFFSYKDVSVPGFIKREGFTSLIDLSKTEEDLWSSMRSGFICDQIIRGERRGIKIEVGGNFKTFSLLDKSFRKDRKLPKYNLRPLKRVGRLYTAFYNGEMLAGAIVISDEKHARALVLSSKRGSNKDNQNAIGQANRMIMWSMIKDAKKSGRYFFDLGGIDIVDGKLTALGEFKEAFGGERKKMFFYHKIYSPFFRFWIRIRSYILK
jgi:hypothetical protein